MSATRENIAAIIKECRTRRKMTQEELAKKSGVSLQAIINAENGRTNPTSENLFKIMAGLDYVIVFRPKEKAKRMYYKEFKKAEENNVK